MTTAVKDLKVSVCVVTYNQEKYIRECLQSILDQEVDFDYEVIVGDDCSTDGTRAIVQEFANKYPEIVKPIFHEKNLGPTDNYLYVHNRAKGKYVSHLDGDDYCLPGKLRTLASFLDRNPDCRIVWHRMHILNEHGQSAVGMPVVPIREFTGSNRLYAKDLAKYYGITGCHSGSMYRASAKKISVRNEPTIDYFFTLSFCIDGGYASYIDEPLGVYRWFSFENTMTRSKGNLLVGLGKLSLIRSYLASNPELAREFSAQCLFEFLLRLYFRQPLRWQYFKMLFKCRAFPSLSAFILIIKVFDSNRRKSLMRGYVDSSDVRFSTQNNFK
ncbi:MAG TPA: glycosyltransferase [Noviherbaspirillum sp.]|nr:glycosyltransferase [Noviherbaspirillum sp.]